MPPAEIKDPLIAARHAVNNGGAPSLREALRTEPKLPRGLVKFFAVEPAAEQAAQAAEHAASVARTKLSNARNAAVDLIARHDGLRLAVAESRAAIVGLETKFHAGNRHLERAKKAVEHSLAIKNPQFVAWDGTAQAGADVAAYTHALEKLGRHLSAARETLAKHEAELADYESKHGRDLEIVTNPAFSPDAKAASGARATLSAN